MLVNVDRVMHLGRGNGQHRYVLDGQDIQRVSEQKDLGVLIADNLKPSAHCVTVYKQTRRVLAMMQRTIIYKKKAILLSLYKTLCAHWSSTVLLLGLPTIPERHDLVRTHPASLHKNVPGVKFLPYEERLVKLGLWTLEERRNRADLTEVFKLVKGLVNNPFDIFFEKSTNSHLRGHSWKLTRDGVIWT